MYRYYVHCIVFDSTGLITTIITLLYVAVFFYYCHCWNRSWKLRNFTVETNYFQYFSYLWYYPQFYWPPNAIQLDSYQLVVVWNLIGTLLLWGLLYVASRDLKLLVFPFNALVYLLTKKVTSFSTFSIPFLFNIKSIVSKND